MEHNMILSASGWRKVFATSGNEQDRNPEISKDDVILSVTAANVFFDYISKVSNQKSPVIALGIDARPTGPAIADAMIHALIKKGAIIQYSGITTAPEIMAFAKKLDGFIYVSASHNPIGHNGIKFGTNNGGVLEGPENAKLVKDFVARISDDKLCEEAYNTAYSCTTSEVQEIYNSQESSKYNALHAYKTFINETITGSDDKDFQEKFFAGLDAYITEHPIGVVCDFNGSSRSRCIDKEYFAERKINFYSINDKEIVHEIIPEAENLVHVAAEMERLHKEGHKEVVLGYMPDCDGDRGNIVYWDEKAGKPFILKAQEVFSLSVLAELTYSIWQHKDEKDFKPAVAVNCPTSMRIDEIAKILGATVFRSEVGEANTVNLARDKRKEGYTIRILGEGSNGGTITHPAAVRDPLNTVFAFIKLLSMRENGLYELWCNKAGIKYNPDFTLTDALNSIPKYTSTGVSEARALLHIKATDHAVLKAAFQKEFEKSWEERKAELKEKYGICSWEARLTVGKVETKNATDFSLSGKGGLKVVFKDADNNDIAFMWMRGSGTEPVFRILCDVKGDKPEMEQELIKWETELISKADK